MSNKIYLVIKCLGSYDDYGEEVVFATHNVDKAKNWVIRYNDIIKNNKPRIKSKYKEGKCCFWYLDIVWEYPEAVIREVEIR